MAEARDISTGSYWENVSSYEEMKAIRCRVKILKAIPMFLATSMIILLVLQIILIHCSFLSEVSTDILVTIISLLTVLVKVAELIWPSEHKLIHAKQANKEANSMTLLIQYADMMLQSKGRFSPRTMEIFNKISQR